MRAYRQSRTSGTSQAKTAAGARSSRSARAPRRVEPVRRYTTQHVRIYWFPRRASSRALWELDHYTQAWDVIVLTSMTLISSEATACIRPSVAPWHSSSCSARTELKASLATTAPQHKPHRTDAALSDRNPYTDACVQVLQQITCATQQPEQRRERTSCCRGQSFAGWPAPLRFCAPFPTTP